MKFWKVVKMISVDKKTNVSQQEMKELVAASFNFHRSTFSKLKRPVK